jgi:hypothetical protein
MSESINHHFVSQCFMKNFKDDNQSLFIYDKVTDNVFKKIGTKKIFSERHLNTRIVEGKFNYQIEEDLGAEYEQKYTFHYNQIINSVNGENIKNIGESIKYVCQLGAIGELRNKEFRREQEKDVGGALEMILKDASPELKKEFEDEKMAKFKLPYKIPLEYKTLADQIFYSMGKMKCHVFTIPNKLFFLLSDCTAVTYRGRINNYFNPLAMEIAEIGMPINSNIFIHIYSQNLNYTPIFNFKEMNEQAVYFINNEIYKFSKKWVACEDEEYLQTFVIQQRDNQKSL